LNFRLASGVRIESTRDGDFLLAERPLRLVRLNAPLLALARRMAAEAIEPQSEAESRVLETLVKKGFVTRLGQGLTDLKSLPSVSVIIPVKDRADELRRCLSSLKQLRYPADRLEVLVVDDGSRDATPQVARELGATLLASGAVGGGPALARNRGAAAASGEIIAFIDSDCTADPDWLADLLPAFAEEQVVAVGGWVDGLYRDAALDRYEAVMSSLNLGRREMAGGAGGDTFYLPSCNLLLRRQAFKAAGGFNSEMQVGEDVDLTWRLRDTGGKILYLPRGTVYHAHRSRLWPFMKRRFEYGTSEGLLQRLHPVRGKRMLLPPMLGLILLCLLLTPLLASPLPLLPALGMLLTDGLRTRRKLHGAGLRLTLHRILAARLRALGSLGYYLGYHLLRYYLPPLLILGFCWPPLTAGLLVLLAGVGLVDYRVRRPQMSLPGFLCCYVLEQLAYACGAFWGCLRLGNFTSYRLRFSGA